MDIDRGLTSGCTKIAAGGAGGAGGARGTNGSKENSELSIFNDHPL